MDVGFRVKKERLFWAYYVSGKMIERGIYEKDFKTYSLQKAVSEFEERVTEIPHDRETIQRHYIKMSSEN